MNLESVIALICTVLLLGYLVFALLRAEDF